MSAMGPTRAPAAGDALSAAPIRGLAADVRRARLTALPPLAVDVTPDGTVIRMRRESAGISAVAETWSVKVRGGVAYFSDCVLYRGACVHDFGTLNVGLGVAGGTAYVSARLKASDNTCDLVVGATLASVSQQEVDDMTPYVMMPLYRFTGSGVLWRPTLRYVGMPGAKMWS